MPGKTSHIAADSSALAGVIGGSGCVTLSTANAHAFICEVTCPLHALRPLFDNWAAGDQPFAGITAATALGTLRAILVTLQIQGAELYRCHDLRRGHAKDLQQSGWVSPPFCAREKRPPLYPLRCAAVSNLSCWRMAFASFSPIFGHTSAGTRRSHPGPLRRKRGG